MANPSPTLFYILFKFETYIFIKLSVGTLMWPNWTLFIHVLGLSVTWHCKGQNITCNILEIVEPIYIKKVFNWERSMIILSLLGHNLNNFTKYFKSNNTQCTCCIVLPECLWTILLYDINFTILVHAVFEIWRSMKHFAVFCMI